MEDSEDIIYIESNFGIEKVKNSHSVVIYKNFRYWWSKENKDTSTRYVCSEKECYASIRIKDNKVTKLGGKHYHDPITIGEIALLRASQDLKKEVNLKKHNYYLYIFFNFTKGYQRCLKEHSKLLPTNTNEVDSSENSRANNSRKVPVFQKAFKYSSQAAYK